MQKKETVKDLSPGTMQIMSVENTSKKFYRLNTIGQAYGNTVNKSQAYENTINNSQAFPI
jgi:hypothetical protein